jgi:hypothetical protein
VAIPCGICGKGAVDKKGLKRHMELRHPGQKKQRRKYTKPAIRTTSIDSSIAKARALGVLDEAPKTTGGGPGAIRAMKTSDNLRAMADSFERKAELLRSMATELDRI